MVEDQKHLRERVKSLKIAIGYHVFFVVCALCSGLAMLVGDNLSRPLATFGILLSGVMFGFLLWRINAMIQAIDGLNAVIQSLEETDDISVSDLIGNGEK